MVDGALPPMMRVPDPHLSLWQSAVRQVTANRVAGGDLAAHAVRSHPMPRAADVGSYAAYAGVPPDGADERRVRLLRLGHELAESQAVGDHHRMRLFHDRLRAFSHEDVRFVLDCVAEFVKFYKVRGRQAAYRDWRVAGGGDIDFGVIEYRLPGDATVALLGDWGTGQDDAAQLLTHLLRRHEPTAIVHLGDIYYSGTPGECARNFADVLRRAFDEVLGPGRSLPVFNLPGNHDYYSGGDGYYGLLDRTNEGPSRQPASYFCLRTEDGAWQLLGMDTGLGDHQPASAANPFHVGPGLQASEVEWLQDKLSRFDGATILLSHHQLFSAASRINGASSGRSAYLNSALYGAFQPYLDRVAAWFWGHEHSLGVFRDGLCGLARGRLLGCSAYEVGAGAGPAPTLLAVPYAQPAVRLGVQGSWLDHGYAVIELGGGARARYFQFPSWSDVVPAAPASSFLHEETLTLPERVPALSWETRLPGGGDEVALATAGERVFAASGGRVHRLDPATGAVMASAELGVPQAELRIAVAGMRLVAAASHGQVFGLDADDLRPAWPVARLPGWGGVTSVLAAAAGLFVAAQGYAYRVDPGDGALGAPGGLTGCLYGEVRLAAAGDALYAGINGFALALGAGDLAVRWRSGLSRSWAVTSVLAAGDRLYAAVDGHVFLLDPRTGEVAAAPALDEAGGGEVRLAALGDLVLAGWDGRLAALRAADGAVAWPALNLADCSRGVVDVAAAGGRAAAGCNGRLYLLEADGAIRSIQDLTALGRGEVRVAVAGDLVLAGAGGAVVAVTERQVGSDSR